MQQDTSGPDEKDSRDTDHEHDMPKGRKRVSRACNRCRTKKDKCDGIRPSCTPCTNANLACSYEQSTKKRGLPEGYVRGLEKLWALSIGKIAGLEDAVSNITDQHHQELLELWNHDTTGEDLHMIWKESKVLSELEHLLSGLERDTPTGSKRKRERDEGGDSPPSEPSSLHRQVQYHVSQQDMGKPAAQEEDSPTAQVIDPQLTSALPEGASKLLDHYFAYTHCWFPILTRPQVLKTFYEHSRRQQIGQIGQIASPDLAVLWAIIAYSTAQTREPLAKDSAAEKSSRLTNAKKFRKIARSLIPSETEAFAIGHVQALLLLSILDIGLGDWQGSWILIGIAVRSALLLNLGSSNSDKRGTGVLQGCFILDTLIADHLQQPLHLRRADMEKLGYLEEDGHEEWEPWNPPQKGRTGQQDPGFIVSCFNRLFDVFLVLNDVVSYTASYEAGRHTYFEKCSTELATVQSKFPSSMASTSQLPPHQVYLRLFYCSTGISVLKQSFEGGAPAAPLAKLSCDVLLHLTQYAQDPILGLIELPSLIEHPVRSACYAAIAAKLEFDSTSELPSYTAFARKMTEHVSQISATWPVYSSLSTLWQTPLRAKKSAGNSFLSNPIVPPNHRGGQETFPFLQPGTFEKTFPPVEWASDPSSHGRNSTFSSPMQTTSAGPSRSWSTPGGNILPFASDEFDLTSNGATFFASDPAAAEPHVDPHEPSIHDASDMSMSGVEHFSPAGLAMPAVEASPSFHGDDVDAIFHNLVHLDTTEWANSRTQGLQDFGFADDMTFQAFCNDPERMAAPGAPFDQLENANAEFWPSGSLQAFTSNERYQNEDERVGWWG